MGDKIFWTIILFVALVGILLVIRFVELELRKRGKISEAQIIAFEDKALQVLEAVGLALFTDAENTYGAGTGVLKKASVIAKLWALMPQDVQDNISIDWLSDKAEYYLELAKEQWAKNARLVK